MGELAPVFLVTPRVLRRVVVRDRRLGLTLSPPHAFAYALDARQARSLVTPRELDGNALPEAGRVVLVSREGDLAARAAFHQHVHLALEALDGAALDARIARLPARILAEARRVLDADGALFDPRDDREVFVELTARLLELARFSPASIADVFPAVDDANALVNALAEGLDLPPFEPTPETAEEPAEEEIEAPSIAASTTLSSDAIAAEEARGNVVRSALARARKGDVEGVREDLRVLSERLARATEDRPIDPDALMTLFAHPGSAFAAIPSYGRRARLLFDLQKACTEAERPIRVVDVVTAALSLFRRPVVRALPAARTVRILQHLRAARDRARSLGDDARPLLLPLERAVAHAEERLRDALRPALAEALVDAGFAPRTVEDRVASRKLHEELLDAIAERGYFTFSQLRDAVSRNALKLPDLTLGALVFGDALLRADRRLRGDVTRAPPEPAGVRSASCANLDGVYRPAEIYLRALQKLSSLFFATGVGRFLVLFAILPILGSFIVLEGSAHVVGPLGELLGLLHHHLNPPRWAFVVVAVAILGLLHSPPFRAVAKKFAHGLGVVLSFVFVAAPLWLARRPFVRAVLDSAPYRWTLRLVVKPALFAAVAYALFRYLTPYRGTPFAKDAISGATVATFAASAVFFVSPAGITVEERASDLAARSFRELTHRFLPSAFAAVARFFRALVDLVERALYAVDEYLRFRPGSSVAARVVKGVAGVFWFFVAYLVRLYVTVLIEPQINPIKHFPVVTVSHKICLPMMPTLVRGVVDALSPITGRFAARAIAGPSVLLLPGAFGFLAWELKENWKLYEANRPKAPPAAIVGHHGETIAELLRPGFHTGTIPKLFTRLRRAHGKGVKGLHDVERLREQRAEIAEAVKRFVEREMIAGLEAEDATPRGAIEVERVRLATARIEVVLRKRESEARARLAITLGEEGVRGTIEDAGFAVGNGAFARWAERLFQRIG